MDTSLTRRGFLRQSFAFSAIASLGSISTLAAPSKHKSSPEARQLLLVGDWGYEDATAQAKVAVAMQRYVQEQNLRTDALLMLGDNWYGPLPGGVASPRWKTQFEDMYPKNAFDLPGVRGPRQP